jgi:hypothetical protein
MDTRNAYDIDGKDKGKRPSGRPSNEDDIKMNLKEIGCGQDSSGSCYLSMVATYE